LIVTVEQAERNPAFFTSDGPRRENAFHGNLDDTDQLQLYKERREFTTMYERAERENRRPKRRRKKATTEARPTKRRFLEDPVHELAELGSRGVPIEINLGSRDLQEQRRMGREASEGRFFQVETRERKGWKGRRKKRLTFETRSISRALGKGFRPVKSQ